MPLRWISIAFSAALLAACAREPVTLSVSETVPQNLAEQETACDPDAGERVRVRARHIVIEVTGAKDEQARRHAYERALEARTRLLAGEPFEKLEAEYSATARSRGAAGGNLGYFKRDVMLPEFERAAFCQRVNEIGPVVETEFGYHIIQVTDAK
jgi:parvulin-like peptidyl-prolyl isomerase